MFTWKVTHIVREKYKPMLLCTTDQSWCEVGVNVVLLVSESCKNGQTNGPICLWIGKWGGGVCLWSYSNIQQALSKKYTGPFSLLTHEMKYSSCGIFILSSHMTFSFLGSLYFPLCSVAVVWALSVDSLPKVEIQHRAFRGFFFQHSATEISP